ncbi:MAG: TrbI/VirB10 family protein [Gammaproteobacteria bacterium]|nr:TrbI/VirB10 family protein [Gammaproteobacteria bacterium]MCP4386995.1 TrbI/VirB10 family protein [Gammaproteobacteria bacterium]MCP5093584.1 TrbI/VirB10 family protein [Gammaproteobacteria bacterium]
MATNNEYSNHLPDESHPQKEPPEMATVGARQPQPRRLRKNMVWGVIIALAGIAILAFSIALLREPAQLTTAEETISPSNEATLPSFVRNAPKNYGEIPVDVPQLGPAMEGDLGEAGVLATPPAFAPPAPPAQPQRTPEEQREHDAYLAALASPITVDLSLNSIRDRAAGGAQVTRTAAPQRDQIDALARLAGAGGGEPLLAGHQGDKRGFLASAQDRNNDFYVKTRLEAPLSPYELKAGSVIPCALITGINSDLPGSITCQVRENVYDTVTGNHLLLPQGTRAVGEYDSVVVYGQNRVLSVWHRLILPDGHSIGLEGMDGVDLSGYAGYADRVNNHWRRLIGAVVLSSLFTAAPVAVVGNDSSGDFNRTIEDEIARNVGDNIQRAGERIVSKNLNIQPTITISPGYSVNIFVKKDLLLAPYAHKRGETIAVGTTN